MAFNVNEFRTQMVGDGARPNLFEVEMPFPAFSAPENAQTKMTFMCRTAQLPGATLGVVPVTYFGRELKFLGNRTFADWTVTIINDEDFSVRNAMERWQNAMNDTVTNTGLINVADYQADLIVEQLDRDDTVLKSYILRGCFPQVVAPIELSYETANAIEEFGVTWRYHHFEASAVNF